MKRIAIAVALTFACTSTSEAGPLRRAAYRITHPLAPVGSYSGPKLGDGTWRARAGRVGYRATHPFGGAFRGCAGGSCARP